jgi:hypothetical protein
MKLKRISDSTNATKDKQNRGISRNFRKPILTRFTAAKYKIQQSSAQSFSRTTPFLRDKIDDNRGNQSDPKGYIESASTFVSKEGKFLSPWLQLHRFTYPNSICNIHHSFGMC